MSPETRDAGSRDIPGDGWSAGTGGIFFTFCSITTLRTIFAPASRSSSRRRGARGAFVGGRGERGERIRR